MQQHSQGAQPGSSRSRKLAQGELCCGTAIVHPSFGLEAAGGRDEHSPLLALSLSRAVLRTLIFF